MNFFNFRSGLFGDTPDKMEQLTAQGADDLFYTLSVAEAVARDAAACVIEGGADYRIGGSMLPVQDGAATKASAQELRL